MYLISNCSLDSLLFSGANFEAVYTFVSVQYLSRERVSIIFFNMRSTFKTAIFLFNVKLSHQNVHQHVAVIIPFKMIYSFYGGKLQTAEIFDFVVLTIWKKGSIGIFNILNPRSSLHIWN